MIQHAVAGEFIRTYKPQGLSVNRAVNTLLTRSRLAIAPSAVVVREKRFPDVSFHQGNINWDAMKSQTGEVIIRAGQNIWEDPQFRTNYGLARVRGMKRGVYWFYDDRIDPGRQAALLVSLIQYDLPEMEVWADWENSYGGAFGGLKNVVAFMQAIEAKLPGVKVGMYTGYYWFREKTNAVTNSAQYTYLKSHPLWLAWYTENPAEVLIPAPWTSLLLWQYGTPVLGAAHGCQSLEIDMNYYNGTASEFAARYGSDTTPQEPPTGELMPYFKVNAAELNMRSTGVYVADGSNVVGKLLRDDIVQADDPAVNGWRRIRAIYRNNVSVTVPASPTGVWVSVSYLVATTFVPPAPPPAEDKIEVYVNGVLKVSGTGKFTIS